MTDLHRWHGDGVLYTASDFQDLKARTSDAREGARTANVIYTVQAGRRLRRESDFEHRFPLFLWFLSVGNDCE